MHPLFLFFFKGKVSALREVFPHVDNRDIESSLASVQGLMDDAITMLLAFSDEVGEGMSLSLWQHYNKIKDERIGR